MVVPPSEEAPGVGMDLQLYMDGNANIRLPMDFETFKQILEGRAGERSELSRGAHDAGRKLAHLPD